ncbi:MAG TPA: Type 1 glutamine amidotransferase-like domain-containing protein [Candidatus Dormibacteraeota bacterium]|nr:Type 1 glutamine amidotransferase-like domain-containing protein [Candidatus Dormibacteraeota bacterium]
MEREGPEGYHRTPRCLLLGSGEFEPWVGQAETTALSAAGGDGTAVVLATASSPEGDSTFERWNRMGLAHYASLDLPARALPVRTREDAELVAHAAVVSRASLIFFSGGNPEYLARTVEGTAVWAAVLQALEGGAVFGGCSAGAMVAGAAQQSGPARGRFRFSGGLDLFPTDVFGVHWDSTFMRVLRPAVIHRVPSGCRLIGIAERTAILTEGNGWRVFGDGAVEVRDGLIRRSYRAGEVIPNGPVTDRP